MELKTNEADDRAATLKMLATHCAVCRLSLRDSLSVELGIGPDCREKYGKPDTEVTPAAREEANSLILKIALGLDDYASIMVAGDRLQELGFKRLHDVLVKKNAKIMVTEFEAGQLLIKTPYNEDASNQLRRLGGQAKYLNDRFIGFSIPQEKRNPAWTVLRRFFAGKLGNGPKGLFMVTALEGA